MDDIELEELESNESNNDENFDEEISAFYSANISTANEIETKLDSDSDNDNANEPLIEKNKEEAIEPVVKEYNEDVESAISEELGPLLRNDDPTDFENSNNQNTQNQNNQENIGSSQMPKLFIKTKGLIYLLLLVFGLMIYSGPKFFYGVKYDKIALAQSSITGHLHDKTFDSGLHFYYPWYKLIQFNKTIQIIELNNTKVFTTDKIQVKISFKIFYKIDPDKLNFFYRKFGSDSEPVLKSVCSSELKNIGQMFSIESYRTKRLDVQFVFRNKLKQRLENDYQIKFYNLYIQEIKFTKVIINLNLLSILNGLYKEKEEYQKIINLTIAETTRMVRSVKNKAHEIIENAKANAQNMILKKAKYDLNTVLEHTHLKYLNQSLDQLSFGTKSVNDTQKRLSFCYLSSLINNENIRILKPGQEISENGFSSKSEKLVGILSI